MPYIFRFHKGTNNNIYDWKASDRITSTDLQEVNEKTNVLSSSVGTSIPTPLARIFLFKTAFEIIAAQVRKNSVETNSIYSGLVSETLDLLELLYQSGSDSSRFRYERWTFENNDEALGRFGDRAGHKLLATSFKQAASQYPFNQKIDITLIYYKEAGKEVLIGGTSPFTFVFTSPNFKRKMRESGFKPIKGMVSGDVLFDSQYLQLQERDSSFIKYIESLAQTPGIEDSFKGIAEYISNISKRYQRQFDGKLAVLANITFGESVLTAGSISLKHVSQADFKAQINASSDFKIELPADSYYDGELKPLFLLHQMGLNGQYTSPSSAWSSGYEVMEPAYPENTIDDIMGRELPGLSGVKYPFFSSFDFFEPALVKLPGYALNDERFVTLTTNQTYAFPIKPLFFHLFPSTRIKEYVTVEEINGDVKFTIKIPIFGPTKGPRHISCSKIYRSNDLVDYSGILGIYPFTRSADPVLRFTNQYTLAAFEKTNTPCLMESMRLLKDNAVKTVDSMGAPRSDYTDINTKTSYYQVNESFDIIQLNFKKNNNKVSGIILPVFKNVQNGEAEYIFAIDFGTSNTHVEYGMVVDKRVVNAMPYEISEDQMQMYLLNKPQKVTRNDSDSYIDYERSMGGTIDRGRQVTLREFMPFQIGPQQSASVRFPFRTATCESKNFINNAGNDRLFIDANIGFNIDEDQMTDHAIYKTDLKWLLQSASSDQFNINRVTLFARELLLMIRTKALLEGAHANIRKLRIILAFPISMGETLKSKLIHIFDQQRKEVLGPESPPMADPVTESIAPYYELKSKNTKIQNDNFCNIDIGGGTTDILLTKTEPPVRYNELQCYCASFRFAGRQLWGSGINEYNWSENGFVSYYKGFVPTVQISNERTANLERVLTGKAVKTEDIVGILFSNPHFKFQEIFAENPNFRVVPLIHYAAILFYITKLAAWKNIALPRTVSFSGKGSEYINFLFPSVSQNNADLKGFTQHLLSLFSGKATAANFIIEKSAEPKVITARGAVYYAAEDVKDDGGDTWATGLENSNTNEKKLLKSNVIYKGFKTLELEDRSLSYSDLMNDDALYRDIIDNHLAFFDLLFDNPAFGELINKRLEIADFAKYKKFFIPSGTDIYTSGVLRDSFKATLKGLNGADKVEDSPFFFPLNYSLIELSKEIASTSKK